jgi:ABC-2 type transport system permease protein
MIRSPLRALAFVRKEIIDVGRQPLLILALIVGPFLILLAFGAGLRDADPQLRAALIVPEDSVLREQVEQFAEDEAEQERLHIEAISSDESAARTQLAARELDLVIVFPDEVADRVEEDEQAVIRIYHNQIDPVEGQAIALFARTAVSDLNDRLLEDIVAEIQLAVEERNAEAEVPYADLDPEVLVSPFRGETELLGGRRMERADFYAPAVVVVLLQHLAVTLLGLSVVRERNLGADDLFRVSPLRTFEYLVGKLLAYLVIGGIVGAALVALLVYGLDTPMQGDWWHAAGALGALLFTSVALGLVIALVANTDSQAVQYAMLVLIATIFLSGFLLSLERFVPAVRTAAWLLPASSGIEMTRDVMLRGAPLDVSMLLALVGYGLVFVAVAAVLVHRRLIRPGID